MGNKEEEPTFEELVEQLKELVEQQLHRRRKFMKLESEIDYGNYLADRDYAELLEAQREGRVELKELEEKIAVILEKLKDSQAVEPLIQALKDEDSVVSRYAAQVLGEIKTTQAMESLIEALKDENSRVRGYAAFGLGKLRDSRAVESLIEALKDENSDVRRIVAQALGELREERSVVPLISALKDEDGHVRTQIEESLRNFRKKEIMEPLIYALKDENSQVRRYAIRILGTRTLEGSFAVESLIEALKDEDRIVRKMAAEALKQIGDVRVEEPFQQILEEEQKDLELRKIAGETSRQLEEKRTREQLILGEEEFSVDKLCELLNAKDENLRLQAAITLGKIAKIEDMDSIRKNIKHYRSATNFANFLTKVSEYFYDLIAEGEKEALFPYLQLADFCMDGYIWSIYIDEFEYYDLMHRSKLKETLTDEDFEELFKLLKTDVKPGVKSLIAILLGAIGNKSAINPIMELLTATENQVVRSAINALASIGDRSTARKVLNTIKEREGIVDVDDLAGIITKLDAFEEFIEIFKDDPELISDVILDIEEHGNKIVKRFIEASKGDPIFVVDVLARVWYWILDCAGEPNYEILSRAKEDIAKLIDSITDEKQQELLKRILREIETEKEISSKSKLAFDLLHEDLASGDTPIQLYAIKGLGRLKSSDSIDKILPFLDYNESKYEWNFKWAAQGALDKIVDPEALIPLIKELKGRGSYQLIEALNKVVKTKLEELINQNDETAFEILYDFLQSDKVKDKQFALWGIKKLQLKKSSVEVLSLLKDEDKNIRKRAVEVLENLGDKTVIDKLRAFLKTEVDSSVKTSIENTLKKLEGLSKKEGS